MYVVNEKHNDVQRFQYFLRSLAWRLKLNKTNNMFNRLSIRHTLLSSPLEN